MNAENINGLFTTIVNLLSQSCACMLWATYPVNFHEYKIQLRKADCCCKLCIPQRKDLWQTTRLDLETFISLACNEASTIFFIRKYHIREYILVTYRLANIAFKTYWVTYHIDISWLTVIPSIYLTSDVSIHTYCYVGESYSGER